MTYFKTTGKLNLLFETSIQQAIPLKRGLEILMCLLYKIAVLGRGEESFHLTLGKVPLYGQAAPLSGPFVR